MQPAKVDGEWLWPWLEREYWFEGRHAAEGERMTVAPSRGWTSATEWGLEMKLCVTRRARSCSLARSSLAMSLHAHCTLSPRRQLRRAVSYAQCFHKLFMQSCADTCRSSEPKKNPLRVNLPQHGCRMSRLRTDWIINQTFTWVLFLKYTPLSTVNIEIDSTHLRADWPDPVKTRSQQ